MSVPAPTGGVVVEVGDIAGTGVHGRLREAVLSSGLVVTPVLLPVTPRGPPTGRTPFLEATCLHVHVSVCVCVRGTGGVRAWVCVVVVV